MLLFLVFLLKSVIISVRILAVRQLAASSSTNVAAICNFKLKPLIHVSGGVN